MKIAIFNRTKYVESLNKLKARGAPSYVIEAYKDGHATTVNEYYRSKVRGFRVPKIQTESVIQEELLKLESHIIKQNIAYLLEAFAQKDLAFLKAFFKMTNLDIMTGEKLPPNASNLLKQGVVRDLGLKDLFKQLR